MLSSSATEIIKTTDTRQLPNACQRSDASTGRPVARHGQRRVGPPFNARHRDRLAARQPADNRLPIRSRWAIEDVTCGPRAAGIAAILGKPLFSKGQMRLRHWDLFSLREGAEPRGLGGDRRLRFSLALARSGGHAGPLRTGIFRVKVGGRIQPLSLSGGRGHSALPGVDLLQHVETHSHLEVGCDAHVPNMSSTALRVSYKPINPRGRSTPFDP